jgi:hypothetical protein
MKKNFLKTIMVLGALTLYLSPTYGQSPEKMSYQAVIRDASNNLVTNTSVGMKISILQGSASGTAVYVETQEPSTNANGLVSIEIGTGTTSDDFTTIDWANGPYFLKTETDPTGGTNYTITGTSQLLSVPYALHAKTAETITGGITETDPLWTASPSFGITDTNISNWDSAYNWGNHASAGYLTSFTETDPLWTASPSFGITNTNISNWDSAYNWGNHASAGYLTSFTETDPIFGASVASGITGTDTTYWNNKQDQLIAGTNITIVGNTISATGGGSSNDFYLGQDTLGGIVFYIYIGNDGNQHGLIVSKTETTAKWQNSAAATGALRTWDGAYNMNLMTDSPAKNWITTNFSTDWYLPSIDELSILWHNRFHVNKALNAVGATLLSDNVYYWSSTEVNDSYARAFQFPNGNAFSNNKPTANNVRAVRAF